jgi:hypothetical protein
MASPPAQTTNFRTSSRPTSMAFETTPPALATRRVPWLQHSCAICRRGGVPRAPVHRSLDWPCLVHPELGAYKMGLQGTFLSPSPPVSSSGKLSLLWPSLIFRRAPVTILLITIPSLCVGPRAPPQLGATRGAIAAASRSSESRRVVTAPPPEHPFRRATTSAPPSLLSGVRTHP